MITVFAKCRPFPRDPALFKIQEAELKRRFLFVGFGGEGKAGSLKLNLSSEDDPIINEIRALVDSWRPGMQWDIKII